ncbi:MAG: alanine racemase [Dehalococcoidia bacterium]|nr:alanine racemase [Dehalococcoidia bacterium]
MRVDELDTPCLLLDPDAVDRNIAAMAGFLRDKPAKLRPHFKTPKTPEVARRQLAAGAIGITVAKLGEAEVLAEAGLGPILMANQVVGAAKVERLVALLKRGVDITVAVEDPGNVADLAEAARAAGVTLQAVIEVDAGMHRCGTTTARETVELAQRMAQLGVRYRGIMGYEGHMYGTPDESERRAVIEAALATVAAHADALAEAGFAPEIVSTSGTASVAIACESRWITELQAGTYVFMDAYAERFVPGQFEKALTLLTTVIAVKDGYAVCDAGSKALTNEFGAPVAKDGSFKAARLSEEHGTLMGDGVAKLRPGQKVELYPTHGDTTLNLHDTYHLVRDGEVVGQWPIAAARKYR